MPLNNFVPKFNAVLAIKGFAAAPKPKKLLLAAAPKGADKPAAKGIAGAAAAKIVSQINKK